MNITPNDGEVVVTADNKVMINRIGRSKKEKLKTPCDSSSAKGQDSEDKSIETLLNEMDPYLCEKLIDSDHVASTDIKQLPYHVHEFIDLHYENTPIKI